MDSFKAFKWTDAHFCSLSSQTNIYGLKKIRTENDTIKLLVSSLDRSFLSVEYQKIGENEKLTPLTKEIQFTYIPGDAEIVSIDAFERLRPNKGLVVGITFIKLQLQEAESRPTSQVLNIYSAVPLNEDSGDENTGEESKLEVVADGCQHLNLDFRPFMLTHTELEVQPGQTEIVFLLSGLDRKVHMYCELPSKHGFKEESCESYFPEFSNFSSSILQLAITKVDQDHRLTATGQQDGQVTVSLVNCQRREVMKEWKTEMDSPITSLSFFTLENNIPCPPFLNFKETRSQATLADSDGSRVNLLMTSALVQAIVYRDVLTNGLSEFLWLPESDRYDVGMCSLAMDIDFDGQNEILVGTYGQELLVYKYFPTTQKQMPSSSLPEELSSEAERISLLTDNPDQADDPSKQRHKSDESNMAEKMQTQRKVKSQEDLVLLSDVNFSANLNDTATGVMEVKTVPHPHFELLWQRSFPCPVMRLDCAEMMGDGLLNLIVLTLHGLHIMQPDLNEVSSLLISRLQQLCQQQVRCISQLK